ncbi:DUF3035 domain-containing protein [Curvivirga aplysinae]|uniref:DUF3035 domain-containing protein n=1 Tax=Curvivirga aplysinae TaxID=2529852 RepID=UPI0012BBAE50|nr:DUF3035 domain-containing protein [Curvivirga aplysinae]MTI11077.1 DUF3035 domain-containing protein [Curvivirga aplysinae]
MSVLVRSIFLTAGLSLLTACGGSVGKVLGLEKEAPDEFAVATRAPLVLPPDFGLRPPDPRDKRAEEDRVKGQAEAALFGLQSSREKRKTAANVQAQFDAGEFAMLEEAGAVGAKADIRDVIDSESDALARANESFVDDFMFWKTKEPGIIVDPEAEDARLSENAGLGRPVTEGDTPMIIREGENSLF